MTSDFVQILVIATLQVCETSATAVYPFFFLFSYKWII